MNALSKRMTVLFLLQDLKVGRKDFTQEEITLLFWQLTSDQKMLRVYDWEEIKTLRQAFLTIILEGVKNDN